jgi:hypothetical protein
MDVEIMLVCDICRGVNQVRREKIKVVSVNVDGEFIK